MTYSPARGRKWTGRLGALVVVAVAVLSSAPSPAFATPAANRLRVVGLGTLPGGSYSFATAVSDDGKMVAGYSNSATTLGEQQHGFLWNKGEFTDLGLMLDYPGFGPTAVNNLGQVIGYLVVYDQAGGFIWSHGVLTLLARDTSANALNNRGQVVGAVGYGGTPRPFLWENGVMTDFFGADLTSGIATDINDRGEIAGVAAYGTNPATGVIWRHGGRVELPAIAGEAAVPSIINSHGDVAGNHQPSEGGSEGFVWIDGQLTVIAPRAYTILTDFNDRGEAVGLARNPEDGVMTPFLWRNGVTTEFPVPVGQSIAGPKIDDRGRIVATSFQDPNGSYSRIALFGNGEISYLPPVGTPNGDQLGAMNEHGAIVGGSRIAGGPFQAAAWFGP
jgi:probable HAF family extracellular repeat protein